MRFRQGRLQREPDFTGPTLTTFKDVFLRHGLPGLLLACSGILFLSPTTLHAAFAAPLADSMSYAVGGLVIALGLSAYVFFMERSWHWGQLGWVVYLGCLSFCEETLFRLVLPQLAVASGLSLLIAVLVSNALFGAVHYFTLRWRWQWCVVAFLCGLALSRHMGNHFDLLLITAFHWIGTFINTPRAPGQGREDPF